MPQLFGWEVASADLASMCACYACYPKSFFPWQVDQLFRAQLFHDRKQYEERRRMSAEERAKTPVVEPWQTLLDRCL